MTDEQKIAFLKARVTKNPEWAGELTVAWQAVHERAAKDFEKVRPKLKSFEVFHRLSKARERFLVAIYDGATIAEAQKAARLMLGYGE